jgi:hypothetical protein
MFKAKAKYHRAISSYMKMILHDNAGRVVAYNKYNNNVMLLGLFKWLLPKKRKPEL